MAPLRTAVYQFAATPDLPSADARLDRLEAAIAAHDEPLDLVVCPELFLSGYDIGDEVDKRAESPDGPSSIRVAALARQFSTAILAGYPERGGDTIYNAAMVFGADGTRLADYRKRLIPPGFEGNHFTPGDAQVMFDLNGWKAAVLICYDVEFPEYVRQAAMAGADLVIVPTALRSMWGIVSDTVLPARAFENGVFIMYANYAGTEGNCEYLGRSVILGPDGGELRRAGGEEELIVAGMDHSALTAARATLPYLEVVGRGLPG